MISVVVPVYNVEKYLNKCVRSILKQTYSDLEIILVNDGSTDSSGRICDEFATEDRRVKVIHKKNGGQSSARNAALSLAKGDYIGFVDSDDTIHPSFFEHLYNMLSREDSDIVMCGCEIVYDGKQSISITASVPVVRNLDCSELWYEVFVNLNNAVWNKLYKRTLLVGMQFPEGMIHGEDLLFNLDYLKRCNRGKISNAKYYSYLKREGSITQQAFSPKKFLEIESKDIAKNIIQKEHPELLDVANLFCFRARMNVLRSIYKTKRQNEYPQKVHDCTQYVVTNYTQVCGNLRVKEKCEYMLFMYLLSVYRLLIKIY